jgi:arylsulfatase A-like enzyme
MTPASFTAMAFLDSKVKQIVDAIEHSGRAKNTTVIVVSDHGFRSYKHKIRPCVLLKQKNLLNEAPPHSHGEAWVLPEGGTADVYVTNPDRKAELVPELRRMFIGIEGIDKVYGTDQFGEIGFPLPTASDQAPDLVLAAKPDYMFSGESEGDLLTDVIAGGTHGYINTDPNMQAIFIAWGAGIPKQVRLGTISNLDVAPTIAALLGIDMKHVRGHAIREIFDSQHAKSTEEY